MRTGNVSVVVRFACLWFEHGRGLAGSNVSNPLIGIEQSESCLGTSNSIALMSDLVIIGLKTGIIFFV